MPAHSITEAAFSVATSTTVQADLPASRPAPATRYRVRVVNCDAAIRLYVGLTAAGASAPTLDNSCRVIEPDFGEIEEFVDSAVAIWVRPASGSTAVQARIIQYATS